MQTVAAQDEMMACNRYHEEAGLTLIMVMVSLC